MKRTLIGAAIAGAVILAVPAAAQMMGGYGPGYGYGPGMMQGYGPGMMQGYGPGGMGWGGGYGPMHGYGPRGYGYAIADLTNEQRAKMDDIERDASNKRWEVMKRMHDQPYHMHDAYASGELDENAARKSYDAMAAAQKEMFEIGLQARKRADAVLTPEQRKQLRRSR